MAFLQTASNRILGFFEKFFYWWGKFVARHPFIVIFASIVFTGLSCIGFTKLVYQTDANKMWIPPDSPFFNNSRWLGDNFQQDERYHFLTFHADNILTPHALREMYRLHKKINEIEVFGAKFNDICYQLPIADIFLNKRKKRDLPSEIEDAHRKRWSRQAQFSKDDDILLSESVSRTPLIVGTGGGGGIGSSSSGNSITVTKIPFSDNTVSVDDVKKQNQATGITDVPVTTTASPRDRTTTEAEYDYDAYFQYDYYDQSKKETVDYNNFENAEVESLFQDSQKEIAFELPPSIYCDLVATLNSKCFERSLLEIWKYHKETIDALTQEDILYAINILDRSPYFGFETHYGSLLGGVTRNESGHIVSASSAMHTFATTVDLDNLVSGGPAGIEIEGSDRVNADWQWHAIHAALRQDDEHPQTGIRVYVYMSRSYSDLGTQAIFLDGRNMVIGYVIMFIYTAVMLGRFNAVEQRIYLTAAGITAVLMGLAISIGLMLAIGYPYMPMHALLPFILVGIGIDDMFVIVQCWYNLSEKDKEKSIEEKIGLTMKHAGVAITVTSFTDVFAFATGCITVLPGLQAFCVSSSIGIASIYMLQASWFVAWLSIDQKRIEEKRNGFVPCYKHSSDWKPLACSQKEIGPSIMKQYSKLIDYTSFKVFVVLLTLAFSATGLYGTFNIRQEFDPEKMLPAHAYLVKWLNNKKTDYPTDGWGASIFTGPIDPNSDLEKLETLVDQLQTWSKEGKIIKAVDSWFPTFKTYIREKDNINDWRETLLLDETGFNPKNFSFLMSNFLFSEEGSKYTKRISFDGELVCNSPAPPIRATAQSITYRRFEGPSEHIPGRRAVENLIKSLNISDNAFSHGTIYAAWETDEVIGFELWRNLGVAMACVFVITLILLADVTICILVLFCVVFTLVDVVGMLHFWDITIDTLSCINIVLAVGLCVDYSAHIAHAFTVSSGSRVERAKESLVTMGPAIMNGGITTFLAVVLLGGSESHVFITFFKVFLLTVLFGLFHGIVFLPVLLSWVGPKTHHVVDDTSSIEDGAESGVNHPSAISRLGENSAQSSYGSNDSKKGHGSGLPDVAFVSNEVRLGESRTTV